MAESRVLPVCVVRTSDNAFKYYAEHDPILVPGKKDALRIPLSGPKDPDDGNGQWHGNVQICKRCCLLYVSTHGVTYAKPTGIIGPVGNA